MGPGTIEQEWQSRKLYAISQKSELYHLEHLPGKEKRKRKEKDVIEASRQPSGWFLYKREVVSKEWRAKRRDDAAQRVADRDRELLLQNRGRVIRSESWKECLDVKQGGLASWDEFLANAWEKYNADQDLKDEFNRKAALYTKPAPVAKTKARSRKDLDAKDTLWQAGYNRGPCSPAVLEKAVRSHKRPHKYSIWSKSSKPRLSGPCNTGKYLGETQALDPMICDDRPRRYTNEKVNIAKLCSDKFPGFCVTEGAHFKNCVLRTCCNFNTCLLMWTLTWRLPLLTSYLLTPSAAAWDMSSSCLAWRKSHIKSSGLRRVAS